MNPLYKYDCNGNKSINSCQKIKNIKEMNDWSLNRMKNILCVLKNQTFDKGITKTYLRVCDLENQIVKEELRRWMNWD